MKSIQETYEQHLPKLEKAVHDFPWEDKASYAMFLIQTYHYVCHSAKLLGAASKKSDNAKLQKHLVHHKEEETGHEVWAADDAKALGYDAKAYPMFEETKNVYQTIYEEIQKVGPSAVMAYAMALEGMSARTLPSIYKDRIQKTYGKKAGAFVKGHAEADPGHIRQGFRAAELLTGKDQEHWKRIFVESIDRYITYLNKIRIEAKSANFKKVS